MHHSRHIGKALALLAGLLLAWALNAQTTPAQAPKTFQDLTRDYAGIQQLQQECQRKLKEFQEALPEVARIPDPDQSVMRAMSLRKRGLELQRDLERNLERQVSFRNDLSVYSSSRQLLRQEQSYFDHYMDSLQRFGQDLQGVQPYLIRTLQQLENHILRIPPPEAFETHGVEFTLVEKKGRPAFYVSTTALSPERLQELWIQGHPEASDDENAARLKHFRTEGVTLQEASHVAAILGLLSGFPCRLPAEKHLDALGEYARHLDAAVWLDDRDVTIPPREKEALQRFGAQMGSIWDPNGALAARQDNDAVRRELPWACYPELGCILTAELTAGRDARLAKLSKLLQEEEESAQTLAPEAPAEAPAPEAEPEIPDTIEPATEELP